MRRCCGPCRFPESDWRVQNRAFERMGAQESRSFRLTGTDEAHQIQGRYLDRHDTADAPPAALINEA